MLGRRPHYSQLAPPLSYIQADAFDSPKDLAAYLHLLSKNNELYNKYECIWINIEIENPLNSYCQKTLNPYKSTFSMLKLVKNRVKVTLRPAARPWQPFERLPAEGVEHTEKYCVGSCIRFASWDWVRVGFTQCGLDKISSIFSALFKGICSEL